MTQVILVKKVKRVKKIIEGLKDRKLKELKQYYSYIKRQVLISHIIAIGNNLKDNNQSIKRFFIITIDSVYLSLHILGYI